MTMRWGWLVVMVACSAPRPAVEGTPPNAYSASIDAALMRGDIATVADLVERARREWPDDLALATWAAYVEQLQWREDEALMILWRSYRKTEVPPSQRPDLMGRIGELLFRSGEYAESVPFLRAGAEGVASSRRACLAQVARALPTRRVGLRAFAAELPLLGGPPPELVCSVDGVQRPFVLDTGASFTTISAGLARELGVETLDETTIARDGMGDAFEARLGVVGDLTLGTVELGPQPVLVLADDRMALSDRFGGPTVAPRGLIGLDVLGRFRVTFDPERSSVVLSRASGLAASQSVECLQVEGRCVVPVHVEQRTLWFVLDTGASHSSLSQAGLRAMPGGERRAVAGFRRVRSPGGVQLSVRCVENLTLAIGDVQFLSRDLPIVVRSASRRFPIHGVLGADLILACRTTFDSGRLRLEQL